MAAETELAHGHIPIHALATHFTPGEYLVLEKTQADMARHVLFPVPNKKLGKGVLVSRTYWGNLLIGPTSREPTDQLTNEQVLRSLIRMAHRVVPDVDVTRVITSYAGLRAKCDRGDFIIEESSKARGFVNVAGIDSPGLTSSPAVALRVVGILQAMNARRASRLQDEGHARLAARVGFPVKPVFMAQRRAIVHIKQPEELRGCAIDHPDPTKNIICRCERFVLCVG